MRRTPLIPVAAAAVSLLASAFLLVRSQPYLVAAVRRVAAAPTRAG